MSARSGRGPVGRRPGRRRKPGNPPATARLPPGAAGVEHHLVIEALAVELAEHLVVGQQHDDLGRLQRRVEAGELDRRPRP